ncbi:hypothetical protein FJY90_08250 [Candidatus Gottesmanbacteria bacterium]|nr:hypothetical protein [Candidatus Gottesmanbacteria bacterium]
MDTAIFSNPKLAALYYWCLLRANWKEAEVFPETNKIILKPGQFITSLETVAKVIGMKSIVSAKNYLNILKNENQIEIKSTNKYTVVTVLNWNDLQNIEKKIENRMKTVCKQFETDNTLNTLNKNIDTSSKAQLPHTRTVEESLAMLTDDQKWELAEGISRKHEQAIQQRKESTWKR